jgi:predicted  nucleic acid-binding Zn-ribbon protein
MLEQDKINEYTRLLKECEEAKQEAQKINTEIAMLKKQGMEKLQEKGYKSLSEANKIDEEIAKIEAEIEEEIPKMREYIASVNEKKEEKERILMG